MNNEIKYTPVPFIALFIFAVILFNLPDYCDMDGSLKQSVKTEIFGTFQK